MGTHPYISIKHFASATIYKYVFIVNSYLQGFTLVKTLALLKYILFWLNLVAYFDNGSIFNSNISILYH